MARRYQILCSSGKNNIAVLTIFRRFPTTFRKIAENVRGRPEDEFKYNVHDLKDKLDISEIINIFTNEDTENTPLESRM